MEGYWPSEVTLSHKLCRTKEELYQTVDVIRKTIDCVINMMLTQEQAEDEGTVFCGESWTPTLEEEEAEFYGESWTPSQENKEGTVFYGELFGSADDVCLCDLLKCLLFMSKNEYFLLF